MILNIGTTHPLLYYPHVEACQRLQLPQVAPLSIQLLPIHYQYQQQHARHSQMKQCINQGEQQQYSETRQQNATKKTQTQQGDEL